jgi:hypothetical protein
MPYAIVRLSDEAIVRQFNNIPKSLQIGKRRVVSPVAVGDEGLGHRFVEVVRVTWDRPGSYYTQGPDTAVLSGNVLFIKREWTAWTQQEIDADVAAKEASTIDDIMDQRQTRAIFALVNEVRQLKGQSRINRTQFRNWFEGLTE